MAVNSRTTAGRRGHHLTRKALASSAGSLAEHTGHLRRRARRSGRRSMILWGNEHQGRAEALAKAYGEKSSALASLPRGKDGITPVSTAGAILSVWGHGGPTTFSELIDVEFGVFINNWKKLNPSLTTVELITCDARHNQDPFSGFAKRVAKFVHDVNPGVTIKALPIGQHPDDHSILWANGSTFCYITAPSKATFDAANARLNELAANGATDANAIAQQMAKERGLPPKDYTVLGGNLNNLRAYLGVIT